MVWIIGTRRRKRIKGEEGPIFYTKSLLKFYYKITKDNRYKRLIKLLDAKNFDLFKKESGIELISSEEKAVRELYKFIEKRIDLNDPQFDLGGRKFLIKINRLFKEFSDTVTYQGDYRALINHLLWKARKRYGWE